MLIIVYSIYKASKNNFLMYKIFRLFYILKDYFEISFRLEISIIKIDIFVFKIFV